MKKIFSIILSLCLFSSAYGNAFTTDCGNIVSITATPVTGYHFTQWQDGNTDNPRQIEVKASASYTASFAPNEYTIIFVNEDGTELQKSLFAYGTMPVYNGATPTKPASAQYTYTFAGWSPAIATVTANATYTATYTSSVNSYTLTLSGENGVVTGAGSYEYGSVVNVSATPLECYQFKQWSDGDTNATREITITDDIELEAIFEVITYTITIESANQEHGTVTIEVVGNQGNPPLTPSVGVGEFSVSETKKVAFAPGNLQYTQSTDTWTFAEHDYDIIGKDNIVIDNGKKKLADKIDMFGWSSDANPSAKWGISTSTKIDDYCGAFVDWGENIIGMDSANTWRTLTREEWQYLIKKRTNADNLKGAACVNGINGVILLPDQWECPAEIVFKSGFSSEYSIFAYGAYQTFTANQWEIMNQAGAIFLPAAGCRRGTEMGDEGLYGNYYTATINPSDYVGRAYYISIYSDEITDVNYASEYGRCVRLVRNL